MNWITAWLGYIIMRMTQRLVDAFPFTPGCQTFGKKNTEALLLVIRHIAEAKEGMTPLARKTELIRQALYKALSSNGDSYIQSALMGRKT